MPISATAEIGSVSILDFEVQLRSGLPRDEWKAMIGAALDFAVKRATHAPPHICSKSISFQLLCVRRLVVR